MGMAPLDYGPVLLRKPFGSRLAAGTLPSGCPCGQNPTVGASPWQCPSFPTSCPFRVRHGRVPQPTRRYPRLWIRRPSFERRRDLNPPDQNAAQHTLRACPSPRPTRPVPRGRPVGGHAPPPIGASRVAGVSRVSTCRCHYPGGIVGSDRSWDGLFHPCPLFADDGGLPRYIGGSAPTLNLSRPARHSLALRPVDSLHRRAVHGSRRLRRRRDLHRHSDSYRLERNQLPGGICTR